MSTRVKAAPDILATVEDDAPPRSWSRRHKWMLATCSAAGFAVVCGIFAWGAVNGTRSGRVWRLVDLHVRNAAPFTERAQSIRDLPFVGQIQWRYVPMRSQWVLDGRVDIDRMEDFLSARSEAASVARSAAGVAFTIRDPGVLTVGTMDAASGTVRLVTWVRREAPDGTPRVIAAGTPEKKQLADNL